MTRRTYFIAAGLIAFLPIAAFLAVHSSYSPGPLSHGHAPFQSQCASCHQPWRGVSNGGCIDCHGDFKAHNDHRSAKLSGKDSELLPGKVIRAFYNHETKADELSCRSCHTDHRGLHPHLPVTAGRNCTFCHQHASIDDVSAHTKKVVQRPTGSRLAFKTGYSHAKEFELLHKRDPSIRHLPCQSCHQLKPGSSDTPESFVLIRAGLALLGAPAPTPSASAAPAGPAAAHSNPAPAPAAAQASAAAPTPSPSTEEQDEFSKLWESVPVTTGELAIFASLKHVNALFKHSQAHLSYRCTSCHEDIERKSKRAGDVAAREVQQCFDCHARKPGNAAGSVAASGAAMFGASAAQADDSGSTQRSPQYKTCTQCHAFHFHGAELERDFPNKAPIARPHPPGGLRLAAYTIAVGGQGGGPGRLAARPVTVQPWWLGLVAFIVTGFGVAGYLRWLPSQLELEKAAGGVAPQFTPEVPSLDDTFQCSVERLYIVGETAGTASINLAMRSGRQAVEFVANRLKFEKRAAQPEVHDVAVIGCGPAGIAAATSAKSKGLAYLALEKSTAASTIRNYPRGKFVQATPVDIAEYGSFFMEDDTSKEGLVKKWEEMLARTGLTIHEREEIVGVNKRDQLFEIKAASNKIFKARYVVMAIGVRGSPRRLGVAGETADRVFYNLVEPEEYKDKHILVVGGGNAGAEVAQALSNPELRNTVSYSFRDVVLGPPVTPENAEKISALQQKALLTVYPSSEIKAIKPGKVVLAARAVKAGAPKFAAAPGAVLITQPIELENDAIFAMLGAELPTKFLKAIGIRMTKKGR